VSPDHVPRFRIFAGPNGSGKSTLLYELEDRHGFSLYRVVSPDEIQIGLESNAGLDLATFSLDLSVDKFKTFVKASTYSSRVKQAALRMEFSGGRIRSRHSRETSYNAALVAGFIRGELIHARKSLSIESVLSHASKLDELRQAKRRKYRTYLYYVAMDVVELSVARVAERVAGGGHDVPEDKIRKRYDASLANLLPALKLAYRAYIFDNSGLEAKPIAEKTPRGKLNILTEHIPLWFAHSVLDQL
jgi:predicted ABC-type ATPase